MSICSLGPSNVGEGPGRSTIVCIYARFFVPFSVNHTMYTYIYSYHIMHMHEHVDKMNGQSTRSNVTVVPRIAAWDKSVRVYTIIINDLYMQGKMMHKSQFVCQEGL